MNRERTLAPYRGVLPDSALASMEEHPSGASCLGPRAGLDRQRRQSADAAATLADPALTGLVLVARADQGSLGEAARASRELRALGVVNQQLVTNGVLADAGPDTTAQAFSARQHAALATAPAALEQLPTAAVALAAADLTGTAALRGRVTGNGRALLAEDLRSPCTEEIAVFGAILTLAESTPIHEAERLQDDLRQPQPPTGTDALRSLATATCAIAAGGP